VERERVAGARAGAQVDPHQAAVGLVQHRRVGHLHGHRVADLRRGRPSIDSVAKHAPNKLKLW
jgi:hypothetical protein